MKSSARVCFVATILAGAAPLVACGGGGGGAPGGGITTPPVPIAPTPTPTPVPTPTPIVPPPIVTPSTSSAEYRRNPGLALIKPQAAWTEGATGAGITVAVIDTGFETSQTDLAGRVTLHDVVVGRTGEPTSNHGTKVAGVIASGFNGAFTVGVAYEASILSVRAESDGTCDDQCTFSATNLAAAIDYARLHGAQVINLSLGNDTGTGFAAREAMQRAISAGIVIVASAGNDGAADADYPGRYAANSPYAGAMISAGALNVDGTDLASFSNRAGAAQNAYLAAPGQDIRTHCSSAGGGGGTCWVVSGTSFAAPHISGALALLLDGFPNISGRDAVDILLRSARDMGAAGTDATYGRGALDIERAFQPLGTFSSPTPAGQDFAVSGMGGAGMAGAAFGDAMLGAAALQTVGRDDYRRLYQVNLGGLWRAALPGNGLPAAYQAVKTTSHTLALENGGALRFTTVAGMPERLSTIGPAQALTHTGQQAAAVSFSKGAVRLDFWNGRGGTAPSFGDAPTDAFVALTQAGQAMRAGLAMGRWTFSAETGASVREAASSLDLFNDPASGREPARYSRAVAAFSGDRWNAAIGAGTLQEPGGPLGSLAPPSSSFLMIAQSRFTSMHVGWRPTQGVELSTQAALGHTDAQGDVLDLSSAKSSSWSVSGVVTCARLGLTGCQGISFSLSQPLRIEGGQMTAVLADVPAEYMDPTTFSRRTLNLSPSGREIDLGFGVWRSLSVRGLREGTLRLQAAALINPGHRADTPVAYGVSASFRAGF